MSRHFERGEMLFSLSRYEEARAEFEQAAAEDVQSRPEALAEMARIALLMDRPKEAVRLVREAVGLAPESPNVLLLAAAVLTERDPASALPLLQTLFRIAPTHPPAFATAARNALLRRRPQEAISHARRGLELDPGHKECLRQGAKAALDDQQGELAREWGLRLLALAPECPRAHALAAELALDPKGEREHLQSKARRAPDASTAFELVVNDLRRTRLWRLLASSPSGAFRDHWPRLLACLVPSLLLDGARAVGIPVPAWLSETLHPFTLLLALASLVIGGQAAYVAWRGLFSAEVRRLARAKRDYMLPALILPGIAAMALLSEIIATGSGGRGLALWLIIVAANALAGRQGVGWRALASRPAIWMTAALTGLGYFAACHHWNVKPLPGFILLNISGAVALFAISIPPADDRTASPT